jgi:hypothetical protein
MIRSNPTKLTYYVNRIVCVLRSAKSILFVPTSIACIILVSSFPVTSQQSETTAATAFAPMDIVKAGGVISFTITIDRAPNFKGANLMYWIRNPNGTSIQSSVELEPMKRVYRLDFTVPVAAIGGTWSLSELRFYAGTGDAIPVQFKPVTFRVIANRNLVFPTAAEAKINPSQIQLLRREALAVQTRIQILKANLTQMPKPPNRGKLLAILQQNLSEGLEAVEQTQRSFAELGGNQSVLQAGKVFFSDLQTSYRQIIKDLAHGSTDPRNDASFITVGFMDLPYPLLAQGPLRVLEQNELAYSVVANKEDLTFDLEVDSAPAGATVFYRRRGDSEQQNNKPTNSTIPSLPYAIWLVRFHLNGYKDEEREHDPFREPNHVLHVELQKQ